MCWIEFLINCILSSCTLYRIYIKWFFVFIWNKFNLIWTNYFNAYFFLYKKDWVSTCVWNEIYEVIYQNILFRPLIVLDCTHIHAIAQSVASASLTRFLTESEENSFHILKSFVRQTIVWSWSSNFHLWAPKRAMQHRFTPRWATCRPCISCSNFKQAVGSTLGFRI